MQNIILQVSDDVDINKIISLLEPFGKTPLSVGYDKALSENKPWLGTIYKVQDFKPLKREELYDR
ncbi:MAG: hypothetical protein LBQ35_02315 [Spirochaetaceae bacterium]|jgi:hypothetical protein|nr:hypothetical protein [Spirochaetaceae bacterium]